MKILSWLPELKEKPPWKCRSQTSTRVVTAISNKWANSVAGVAVIWKLEPFAAINSTSMAIIEECEKEEMEIFEYKKRCNYKRKKFGKSPAGKLKGGNSNGMGITLWFVVSNHFPVFFPAKQSWWIQLSMYTWRHSQSNIEIDTAATHNLSYRL